MTPELRETLEQQLERTKQVERARGEITPWVFHRNGKPIKSFRRAWATACIEAGFFRVKPVDEKRVRKVPSMIPHDFRRSAVLNLERAGIPRSAAKAMVGHKTDSVYNRYAIADAAMLRDAGEKLAALHQADQQVADRKVVPLRRVPARRSSGSLGMRLTQT